MTAVGHAELKRLAEVISDEEIARVHGRANFGPMMTPRDVVNEGVLKYAIGYHSGHTQLCILLEHGLITKPRPGSYDANLTKKGKSYARALYGADITLRSFRIQAPDSWRPIETAPKDGSNFDSQDRTNYGKRVFTKTHWYVHPSVQDWVTDEIDCGDYEFEPTHWRPSALTGSAQG